MSGVNRPAVVTWTVATALVAMLGTVVSGCGGTGAGDPPAVEPESPPDHETVTEAFGIVRALSMRSIYVDIPAVVTQVHVSAAQSVERGEALVTLDLEEYRTLLAARETTLAIERLALTRLEQNLERDQQRFSAEFQSARNQLIARETEREELEREYAQKDTAFASGNDPELRRLRIDLEEAQAEARQAREDHARQRRLGVLPAHQVEQLGLAAESRERGAQSLEVAIESWHLKRADALSDLQTRIAAKAAEIANLRLALEAMAAPQTVGIEIQRKTAERLEVDLAALLRNADRPHLDGARVVADIDRATVAEVAVGRGDPVGPGRLVLRLVDLESLIVEADVPEEFIRDVRIGAPVTIIPLADTSRQSYGTVRQIAGMAVNRSGETIVPVQVSIDDDQGYLLPNFNVDVTIGYETEPGTSTSPS